jgi:predicted RNase H-like HicB family nuclease
MEDTPRTLTAALHREEDWYVAQCLEVDVASQGQTIDEALVNLAEAVELYLEEVDDPAGHLTATPLVTCRYGKSSALWKQWASPMSGPRAAMRSTGTITAGLS